MKSIIFQNKINYVITYISLFKPELIITLITSREFLGMVNGSHYG